MVCITAGVDWHYGDKLNEAVHKYYAKYARHSPQFEQARHLHLHVLEDIRKHLSDIPKFPHSLEQIADAGVAGDTKDSLIFRVHFIMVGIVAVDLVISQSID